MPFVASCPECGGKIRVPGKLVGTNVQCPQCKEFFIAENPAGAPAPGPAMKPCPACASSIPEAAKKCPKCGEILDFAWKAAIEAQKLAERAADRPAAPIFNNVVGGGGGGSSSSSSSSAASSGPGGLANLGRRVIGLIIAVPLFLCCSCGVLTQMGGCLAQRVVPVVNVSAPVKIDNTVVKVAPDLNADGKLRIDITCPDAGWSNNLEMFIDGQLRQHNFNWNGSKSMEISIKPGQHSVSLKKNGITVYAGNTTVNRADQAPTIMPINLVVAGTIEIRLPRPVKPGFGVFIEVDDDRNSRKEWAVDSTSISVRADVGKHKVACLTTQPKEVIQEQWQVDVEPGKTKKLSVTDK